MEGNSRDILPTTGFLGLEDYSPQILLYKLQNNVSYEQIGKVVGAVRLILSLHKIMTIIRFCLFIYIYIYSVNIVGKGNILNHSRNVGFNNITCFAVQRKESMSSSSCLRLACDIPPLASRPLD